MDATITYLTVGKWKENSYLLEYKGDAFLIDPGDDFEDLDNFFNVSKYNLQSIINTHGHFDHIGAVEMFKKKYDIPFYIHAKDKQLVGQGNLYRKLAGAGEFRKTPEIDGFLDETKTIEIKDKVIKIHATPGHTYGSVCFEIDKMLISGDLIFKDVIGRTDLPGGNKSQLLQSVKYVIDNFIGYTIYPGHGSPFILDENISKNLMEKL